MSSKIVLMCFVLQLARGSLSNQFRNDGEPYCYDVKDTAIPRPQHEHFTTKTGYALVKGTLEGSEVPSCVPVKIWLLTRHGTIYPMDSTIDIDVLESLMESIKALNPPPPLCPADMDLLDTWTLNVNITDHPGKLSEEGRNQIISLAGDYKTAFGNLFGSPENVVFRHTTELRNTESFNEFATALFGESDVDEDLSYDELLFEFYRHCPKWNESNDKLHEAESDLSKFEESDLFKETIKEISDRLGQTPLLSWEQVKNIWDMCRIDKALTVADLSPWCSAFTEAHVGVLEYHEDIELYHTTGHGGDINPRLACKTVVDLIDHLNSANDDLPKAIVSFTDATTVQLFLTALGTHKDTLLPNTDMDGMDKRKWKSSEMSPFASNIAVVKYDCPNADVNPQVKFFLNQKLLTPDWCTNSVCGYDAFTAQYASYKANNCTEYFCGSETSGKAKIAIAYGVEVFAVTVSLILLYFH